MQNTVAIIAFPFAVVALSAVFIGGPFALAGLYLRSRERKFRAVLSQLSEIELAPETPGIFRMGLLTVSGKWKQREFNIVQSMGGKGVAPHFDLSMPSSFVADFLLIPREESPTFNTLSRIDPDILVGKLDVNSDAGETNRIISNKPSLVVFNPAQVACLRTIGSQPGFQCLRISNGQTFLRVIGDCLQEARRRERLLSGISDLLDQF
jgi:hypothetical protein